MMTHFIIHFDRYRAFKEAISKNINRYMEHKEPTRIDHVAYPNGTIVKFVPLNDNYPPIKCRTAYPDGKIVNN